MLPICFMVFCCQLELLRRKKFLNQIILTWSPFRLLVWRCAHNKKGKIEAFYSLVEHLLSSVLMLLVVVVLKFACHCLSRGQIVWALEGTTVSISVNSYLSKISVLFLSVPVLNCIYPKLSFFCCMLQNSPKHK